MAKGTSVRLRRLIECLTIFIACVVAIWLIWDSSTDKDQPSSQANQSQEQKSKKPEEPKKAEESKQAEDSKQAGKPKQQEKKEKKLPWEALATCELLAALAGIALSWLMIEFLKEDEPIQPGSGAETQPKPRPGPDSPPRQNLNVARTPGPGSGPPPIETGKTQPKRKPAGGLFSTRSRQIEAQMQIIQEQALRAQRNAADSIVHAAQEQAAKEIAAARRAKAAAQKTAAMARENASSLSDSGKVVTLADIYSFFPSSRRETQQFDYAVQAEGGIDLEDKVKNRVAQAFSTNMTAQHVADLVVSACNEQVKEQDHAAEIIQKSVESIAAAVQKAAYGSSDTEQGGGNAS